MKSTRSCRNSWEMASKASFCPLHFKKETD